VPRDESTRQRLKRQSRSDTVPELAVRRLVHAKGLRYRVDKSPVAGMRSRADLVFKRAKVAVFIDGCFWHGCPEHSTMPKNNPDWWREKLSANKARDLRIVGELETQGWVALRFWEHEPPELVAEKIQDVVRHRT